MDSKLGARPRFAGRPKAHPWARAAARVGTLLRPIAACFVVAHRLTSPLPPLLPLFQATVAQEQTQSAGPQLPSVLARDTRTLGFPSLAVAVDDLLVIDTLPGDRRPLLAFHQPEAPGESSPRLRMAGMRSTGKQPIVPRTRLPTAQNSLAAVCVPSAACAVQMRLKVELKGTPDANHHRKVKPCRFAECALLPP
ncbi:hypothetical protein BU26DRAFT_213813 [Trematosphaeria pertusa]|uniref:Uncharacterized protein n=1 Tax=Trematosphaeria pertusa TaxID=390896 RepID=A0A6A6IV28_9PLEO|nr:uncharacterized protein BU26DRAFT_213813 [Trematosphaeria pertusa]KAF2253043.1 hypothetical protein BU26DRAFT_213813 [Trematosphaeria pertusa]